MGVFLETYLNRYFHNAFGLRCAHNRVVVRFNHCMVESYGEVNALKSAEEEMVIEVLSITAPQGKRQELGRALASLVGPIGVQSGCLGCRLLYGWSLHDFLQFQACWETEKDLVEHLQSDIYKRILSLVELSAVIPGINFYSVLEMRGLDLVETARTSPS